MSADHKGRQSVSCESYESQAVSTVRAMVVPQWGPGVQTLETDWGVSSSEAESLKSNIWFCKAYFYFLFSSSNIVPVC